VLRSEFRVNAPASLTGCLLTSNCYKVLHSFASCRSTSECGEASNKSLHERAPIKNFVQQFSRTSEFAKPFFLAQPRTGRCAVAPAKHPPIRLYQFLVACKRQRQRRLSGSVQCSTHDPMRKPAVPSSSIRVAHGHMKLP